MQREFAIIDTTSFKIIEVVTSQSVYLVFRHHITSFLLSLLVVYPASVVLIVALKNLLNSIEKVSLLIVFLITQ